ncbi:hypothetical protein UFOVP19_21 [uncultured Caudovirales phage]|uniref:Uncharacterized protein n=1 Tax=uncultured Caudovirales phage TaxID=2100421 RepID=A0A6J5KL64_9CAUD|nr:hypothetical protein UFOVP19_21 [uncultured Caudovirales phage]
MKMPKGFNKWTSSEKEAYLVKRLQEYYAIESEITKMLARLRGGQAVYVNEIDRPDELSLKS